MEKRNPGEFPAGLMRWAGQRDGGVRKPFESDSGRPAGKQFKTPVVTRLRGWVDALVTDGAPVPRAILLVGGPGNGKTDAVEGCIGYLDERLGAGGSLISAFSEAFDVADDQLPPRKVVVDLARLPCRVPSGLNTSLALVQDATQGEPGLGRRAEELLLTELDELLDEGNSHLYLCCVNRGILANAAAQAAERGHHGEALALLERVTEAVTSGPPARACWPLEDFPRFAAWPMDVESLVTAPRQHESDTVLHGILRAALDADRWGACVHDLGPRCPFCRNRILLSDERRLDALVRVLRYYELATGQRWTFRDLYSLVAYLLVGERDELKVKGKLLDPCEWAAWQLDQAGSGRKGSPEQTDAPYFLVSRLYHHRLFPRWPTLARGTYLDARKRIFKAATSNEGLDLANGFFRYATKAGMVSARAAGNVPERVRGPLARYLDPAQCAGLVTLFEKGGNKQTVADVETCFNQSVDAGARFVDSQVEPLERDVFKLLSLVDDALSEDRFGSLDSRHAQLLQSAVRQFACRLAKRSLGSRYGACKDIGHLQAYEIVCDDVSTLNDVRKQLRRLLNDGAGRFKAGLATTFGQPVALRARDVAVHLNTSVSIKEWSKQVADDRPVESLPYLLVGNHYVPLTFGFFKAMRDVVSGMHQASLPAEIYSLLDRVKATVAGTMVRDSDLLDEEAVIVLGSGGDQIDIVNGEFRFSRGGLP